MTVALALPTSSLAVPQPQLVSRPSGGEDLRAAANAAGLGFVHDEQLAVAPLAFRRGLRPLGLWHR
jgi:hypothetical protein